MVLTEIVDIFLIIMVRDERYASRDFGVSDLHGLVVQ